MKDPFKIGDRVTRPIDVFDENSQLKHVVVVSKALRSVQYPEDFELRRPDEIVYAVKWDGEERISEGYFHYGIDKE